MQIRRDILNATYAAIGLSVAAAGWALDEPRGCSAGAVALAVLLAAALASGYVCWQQSRWVGEHKVIQAISRTLGCFSPGHFAIEGSHYPISGPLYPPEWACSPPKFSPCGVKASLVVIWAFAAGSVFAMCAGWGVETDLAVVFSFVMVADLLLVAAAVGCLCARRS